MSGAEAARKCLAVVRVRGLSDIPGDIKDTLRMLRLTRNCHATLVDDRPSYLGMLKKAQNFITWGEIDLETLTELLRRRGRLVGDKPITDEYAKKLGYKNLKELAKAIHQCKVEFWKLPQIKPIFRLHPPSGGYKGKIKRSFVSGGVTGYRGSAINDLVKRMM
ncbi:50S ribosomal protein L30 [Candidatus Bathyarchaeota archaeon]|nr:MAG: 50S ribosomal protein L30 [Candidatus Bathyarchaeota archaeon]